VVPLILDEQLLLVEKSLHCLRRLSVLGTRLFKRTERMPIMYPAGIDRRGGSIANNTAVTCHLDSENTLYPLWFLHALCSKNSNKEYKGLHKEATSLFFEGVYR
jgi:hypothetical protein